MTSISQVDVNANLDERLAIWQTVRTQLDATGHKLLERLDQLHGEALVAESDRILAIAGRLCMQFEAPDLFRRIYATVLDGCQIGPGDELRFLRAESRESQPQTTSAPVVTTASDEQGQPLQVA